MGEHAAPRRRAGLAAAAVLLTLIAILWGVTFTPLFALRHVEVEGNVALTSSDVSTLGGIGEGTNVFHLDAERVERAIEEDPWVASATVERDLPTTVVVHVVEREPVARAGTRVFAADGTVLPDAPMQGIPEISTDFGPLDPDDVRSAAGAAGAMAPVVRERVDLMLLEPDGDLLLTLRDGVTVVYGRPGQEGAKAESLRALLRWAGERGVTIESADVSVPSAPTLRLPDGVVLAP
jgi:cell division protein FtsQ